MSTGTEGRKSKGRDQPQSNFKPKGKHSRSVTATSGFTVAQAQVRGFKIRSDTETLRMEYGGTAQHRFTLENRNPLPCDLHSLPPASGSKRNYARGVTGGAPRIEGPGRGASGEGRGVKSPGRRRDPERSVRGRGLHATHLALKTSFPGSEMLKCLLFLCAAEFLSASSYCLQRF